MEEMDVGDGTSGCGSKILCLHGYRQCANIFKQKIGSFRKLLKDEAELCFIDAPNCLKNDSNERGWWIKKEDLPSISNENFNNCVGLQDSINQVKNICQEEGPFDGLMGFSQGAAFIAILCSLIQNDMHFKYVILISGFKSSESSFSIYYTNILKIPSLHVIGESDTVVNKQRSEELAKYFESTSVELLIHKGGHYVPASKIFKQKYISFIKKHT
ncbi:hypothetical protein PGB90_004879 [Kerria lacca]